MLPTLPPPTLAALPPAPDSRPGPACPGVSTVNPWSERLTSGGSISIPISSQRATKNGTLSLVDITDEISAAMYSAVWLAFSHAVR